MYEEEEKKKGITLGKLLAGILYAAGLFIIFTIIFRSYKMSDIPLCDDLICDEEIISSYEENPEEFKVLTYGLRKRFESVNDNKLLQMKYLYYIPSARQMQVTVKFNKSYGGEIGKDEMPLRLVLKDAKGNTYDNCYFRTGEKYEYGYLRISYRNIEFTADSEFTLYVYLPEETDTSKYIGRFTMQDANSAYTDTKLTKKVTPELIK